jgi:hypothetical protein
VGAWGTITAPAGVALVFHAVHRRRRARVEVGVVDVQVLGRAEGQISRTAGLPAGPRWRVPARSGRALLRVIASIAR